MGLLTVVVVVAVTGGWSCSSATYRDINYGTEVGAGFDAPQREAASEAPDADVGPGTGGGGGGGGSDGGGSGGAGGTAGAAGSGGTGGDAGTPDDGAAGEANDAIDATTPLENG